MSDYDYEYERELAFRKKNALGKKGEKIIRSYFKKDGLDVVDCSNILSYQKRDIDMLIRNDKTRYLPLEVKTDDRIHETGNVAIEISMTRDYGKQMGWFFYCEARLICYYDINNEIAYFINWPELRKVIPEYIDQGRWRVVPFTNKYDKCPGELCLIPIKELKKRGFVYRETKIA